MTRKEYVLMLAVVILAVLYAVFFTDWFRSKSVRIESTVRSLREAWAGGKKVDLSHGQANSVSFAFDRQLKLTSVKVVPMSAIQTNPYAHSLWTLVSKEGSAPVRNLTYGGAIKGMAPAVAGIDPEPLEPGVEYRLLIEAHSVKGTNDFVIPQKPANR